LGVSKLPMGGYVVAGPPSTFRLQPNDSRTVRFPAIFALRMDFVRYVRVAWADSMDQLPELAADLVGMNVDIIFAPASTFVECCICSRLLVAHLRHNKIADGLPFWGEERTSLRSLGACGSCGDDLISLLRA
jgi:hypothetical protein